MVAIDQRGEQGGDVVMGLVVWAVLLAIPAGMVGGGGWLLYERYAGTSAQATVLACESSGNGVVTTAPSVSRCCRVDIDGHTVTGGFVAGNGASDVGRTVGATVRSGTAYSRSLALPLILLALGTPFLIPVVVAIRKKVGPRPRRPRA